MEALQKRIESFKTKRIKHGSKNITIKWPHGDHFVANPQSLAEAGFYFDPSFDDRDAVKCFMCAKSLSEWEEDDDPFEIHWKKCAKSCAWAVVRCGLGEDIGTDGSFEFNDKSRLPTAKAMEKARLTTFTAEPWWPHSGDHGAAAIKMAQAGFVYTPQYPNDDLATCLYCKVSLSGWDQEDNPLEEHRQRQRKSDSLCPFFALSEPPSKPPSRKPSSKASGSKAHKPKAPSRSETVELFEDDELDNDEQPAVMKGAKTPRKPRGTAASTAKTPRTVTRSKSKPLVIEEEDEALPPPKPTKSSKSRSKAKEVYEDIEEVVVDEQDEPKPRSAQPRKSSRTRSKSRAPNDDEKESEPPKKQKKAASKSDNNASDSDYLSVAESSRAPPSRSTSKSRAAVPSPPEDDDIDDLPTSRRQPSSRPTTGHSRKPSRSQTKANVVPDNDPVDLAPAPSRPTTGHARKPSRSQSKTKVIPDADPEEAEIIASPPSPPPPKKLSRTKATVSHVDQVDEDVTIPSKKSKGKSKAKATPEPKLAPSRMSSEEPEAYHDAVDDHHGRMDVVEDQFPDVADNSVNPAVSSQPVSKPTTARQKPSSPLIGDQVSSSHTEIVPVLTKPVKIGPPVSAVRKPSSAIQRPPISSSSSGNISRATSQVVDILTDDEDEQPPKDRPHAASVKQAVIPATIAPKQAPKMQVEVVLPPKPSHATAKQSILPSLAANDDDIVMAVDTIDTAQIEVQEPDLAPHTPPRPITKLPYGAGPATAEATTAPLDPLEATSIDAPKSLLPAFHPPLSKLPFQQVDQLTEAELDMTVEEWIRFQMSVEYEKFRRDGEREIGRFKDRAEEIRRAIAAL